MHAGKFIVGSIALHAAVVAAAVIAPRPPSRPRVATVELAIVPAAPRTAAPVVAAPVAAAAPRVTKTIAPAGALRPRATTATATRAESHVHLASAAVASDGDDATLFPAARDPLADSALPGSLPPPPPAPRVTVAVSDDGWDRLSGLVRMWQHNDVVRECLEHAIDGPLYLAARAGDHQAALAWVRRAGQPSLVGSYQRARRCLR
jgi:hypothetical protein